MQVFERIPVVDAVYLLIHLCGLLLPGCSVICSGLVTDTWYMVLFVSDTVRTVLSDREFVYRLAPGVGYVSLSPVPVTLLLSVLSSHRKF